MLGGKWIYEETQRIKSPDGTLEAVIGTGGGGATTSTLTLIYIVKTNAKVSFEDRRGSVFGADHIKGLSIRWKNSRFLDIQFDEARIMDFSNYWAHGLNTVVEVKLSPTNPESSLPEQDKLRPSF